MTSRAGDLSGRTVTTSSTENIRERVISWLGRSTNKKIAIDDVTELSAAIGTTIGQVRSDNQDRAIIARYTNHERPHLSFLACALADGAGGMSDGARCAEIALGTFVESLIRTDVSMLPERVTRAVRAANDRVYEQFKGRGGTTAVVLVFTDIGEVAVSAGDSRLYTFTQSQGLDQVSADDTIGNELMRIKGLKASNEKADQFSVQLLQYVGMGPDFQPRVYATRSNDSGIVHILTSDGAHSIALETFQAIMHTAPSLYVAATRILNVANWCGGKDNASVICVESTIRSALLQADPTQDVLLEIWDSFSKLDLIVSSGLRPKTLPASEKQSENVANGPVGYSSLGKKDFKKRKQRQAIPKERGKGADDTRERTQQRTLQIEVSQEEDSQQGTAARESQIAPSTVTTPETTDSANAPEKHSK